MLPGKPPGPLNSALSFLRLFFHFFQPVPTRTRHPESESASPLHVSTGAGKKDIVLIIRALVPYWEEAVDALATEWGERGQVTVISGGSGEDPLHPWDSPQGNMKKAGLIVIPPSGLKRFGTVWPRRKMWETLNRLAPSLIIIHEYSPFVVFSGLVWAKAQGCPCVVTSDVGPVQRHQLGPLQKIVHALVNASVDGVLARTQDALDQSLISQKSGLLAPHAVDTRFYELKFRSDRSPKRIIQVGSLIPRKGVDLLLKAFALAKKTRDDLELVFVGAGDHAGTLRLADELGVGDSVTIHDFLQSKELAAEYARSDIFVLASRFDSYGVVAHEAAASGLPLVISKFAGSSSTLVVPGANGFQVDPNKTQDFSDAILHALDPALNADFSKKSREIAEKYDVQSVAHRTVSWLTQIVGFKQSGAAGTTNRSFLSGCLRLVADVFKGQFKHLSDFLAADAFSSIHRQIVFLNRYVPFYRQTILQKIANWKLVMILYSGKTLGNLKTAEGLESAVVNSFETHLNSENKIIWLSPTLKLFQIRPDVVCTELSLSLLSTWWLFVLRRLLRFRIVFWTHGFQNFGWRDSKLDWKDRIRLLWINWADSIIFYSDDRKADVEKFTGPNAKYFVALNTVDTSNYISVFETLENEGLESVADRLSIGIPSMIFVGRLTAEKEVLGLAELLRMTASCTNPPDLQIVGSGELTRSLELACSPFQDRVRFHGAIFDTRKLGELIYCSSIMVSPGYLGLNVVDSLAMGCPFATIHDMHISKRHSPERCYLTDGQNAIFASGMADFGRRLCEWFNHQHGVALSRSEIRRRFLESCSLENQFSRMSAAFEHKSHSLRQ